MGHRLAMAGFDGLHTIMTVWSLVDVYEAHATLVAWEDAKARAEAEED